MHCDFLKQEKEEKTMLHFNVKTHFCSVHARCSSYRLGPFRNYNGVLLQAFGVEDLHVCVYSLIFKFKNSAKLSFKSLDNSADQLNI